MNWKTQLKQQRPIKLKQQWHFWTKRHTEINKKNLKKLKKKKKKKKKEWKIFFFDLEPSAFTSLLYEESSISPSPLSNTLLPLFFLATGILRLFDVLVGAANFSEVSDRTLFLVVLVAFGVLGVSSTSTSVCWWCCSWGMECGLGVVGVYLPREGVSWTGESKCVCFAAF